MGLCGHEQGLTGLPTALLCLAIRKGESRATFAQEDRNRRRVPVHHRLFVRPVADPQHPHLLILHLDPVVFGVHFDRILSSNAWRENISIDEFKFESEPLVRVAGWFLRPAKGGPFPTIVYVSEGNRNQVVQEGSQISEFARKGFAVCAVDLRGIGLSMPHCPAAGPIYYHDSSLHERYVWAFFTLGKPVLGQRVWDFLCCLDYLQSRRDVDQSRIRGLGEKGAALAILLAGVLDDRLQSLLLDRPLATYQSVVESEAYSLDLSWFLYSVLNHFDLPDLIGSLAPRPCWILNAADSDGETLPQSEILARYTGAIEMFTKSDAGRQLRFIVCPEGEKAKIYSDWLQTF